MVTEDFEPDSIRFGDFDIVREIGRGGMGVVYEARQRSLNRRVALKVLSTGLGLTAKAVKRFKREAEAAAKLHHTNIVPIYFTGEEKHVPYYVMELVDGPSLDQIIGTMRHNPPYDPVATSRRTTEGATGSSPPLPAWVAQTTLYRESPGKLETKNANTWAARSDRSLSLQSGTAYFDNVARMISDVAEALAHAHEQGVIHRDIKPSNLLLSSDGRLNVNDFGLARVLEQPGMTVSGEFVGSPLYMSPEQITAGRAPLDHRTDIYSLGATLYELLTFQPPFPGKQRDEVIAQILYKEPAPLRKLNKQIPLDLETICLKAIERDPDKRYQSAEQMAADLRNFVNRFAITARRPRPVERLVRWSRRRPALAVAWAAMIAAILAAAVFAHQWRAHTRKLELEETKEGLFVALLSGDFEEAEHLRERAFQLDASVGWDRIARGQIELYRGDYEQAAEHLRRALNDDPTNIPAKSMLAIATLFGGDEDAYFQQMLPLAEVVPATFEDNLFLGNASTWVDPRRGFELLQAAYSTRPKSTLVRLLRAKALRLVAMDEVDTGEALELVEESIVDASATSALLEDNPVATAEFVFAQLVAHNLRTRSARERPEKREEHLQAARQHIMAAERAEETLRACDDSMDAHYALAFLYQHTNNTEGWDWLIEQLDRKPNRLNPYVPQLVGYELFRRGQYSDALRWLEKSTGRQAQLSEFLKYIVLLAHPARENSREQLHADFRNYVQKKIESGHDTYSLLHDATVLTLLGDRSSAKIAAAAGERGLGEHVEGWSPALRYIQRKGIGDWRQAEKACGNSRRALSHVHFALAMEALSQGDRSRAITYFTECCGDGYFFFYVYWASRALLAHMERHTDWPSWTGRQNADEDPP